MSIVLTGWGKILASVLGLAVFLYILVVGARGNEAKHNNSGSGSGSSVTKSESKKEEPPQD